MFVSRIRLLALDVLWLNADDPGAAIGFLKVVN
jgi:hypothetical protein